MWPNNFQKWPIKTSFGLTICPTNSFPLFCTLIGIALKRYGDKAWMQSTHYIVTICHGNDEVRSTSCLIMQHKPYIIELSFMETQESNDSINEGPSITMEGPSQTNAVLVPLHDVTCRNHWTKFKSDIKLYTPYPCHLSHSLALLHIL